jgi:hypothetical protein
VYHDWSVNVILDENDATRMRWKLWLNGTLLEFVGENGAHDYNGTRYSFQTLYSHDAGTEDSQFRLGELNNQSTWDFEFDCIAYRDDLNDGQPLYCGVGVEYCGLTVSHPQTRTAAAYRNEPAVPASFAYQVVNLETPTTAYTVQTSDAGGSPMAYSWLALNTSGSAGLATGASDTVVASIINTDLSGGTHTAYLTFTDDCDPAKQTIRRIDLNITECLSYVDHEPGIYRTVDAAGGVVDDAVFTVMNAGSEAISYTVEKIGVCDWLTLDKAGGGPLMSLGDMDQVAGEIDVSGLAAGLHSCQIRFTDNCNSGTERIRTVHVSVRDEAYAAAWYAAEFEEWEGMDDTTASPMVSFPNEDLVATFVNVDYGSGPIARGAPPGWLTQGSIDGVPTTAKLYYYWPEWARAQIETRDAEVERQLPLRADQYNPAKGLAWVWRQRLGNSTAAGTDPRRGPVQLVLPTVHGQEADGSYSASVPCYNAYINILGGGGDPIREVRILNNGGGAVGGIDFYLLPYSLVDEYHIWSVSGCYDAAFDPAFAYWNLYIDGRQLLFGGTNGSVAGPGGGTYSFRTSELIATPPYIRYGETGNTSSEYFWDMEVDYIRMTTLDVSGAPYWDGQGWRPEPPAPACGEMWADADEDGDVDHDDFAILQRCINVGSQVPYTDNHPCLCFDRNGDGLVDLLDIIHFAVCATGPVVPYDLENLPPGCVP